MYNKREYAQAIEEIRPQYTVVKIIVHQFFYCVDEQLNKPLWQRSHLLQMSSNITPRTWLDIRVLANVIFKS